MRQFVPIEPTINAAEIKDLQVVTTALLDDGTTAVVPNATVIGDYVVANPDGTVAGVKAKADFEAHYKAA